MSEPILLDQHEIQCSVCGQTNHQAMCIGDLYVGCPSGGGMLGTFRVDSADKTSVTVNVISESALDYWED